MSKSKKSDIRLRYYPRIPSKLKTKLPIKRIIDLFDLKKKYNPLSALDKLLVEVPDPGISEYGWDHYDTCLAECIKYAIIHHNENTLEIKLNMFKQFFSVCDELELLVTTYYNLIGG